MSGMPRFQSGLTFLAQEVKGLQAAVYVLALSAVFSSMLALVRDRLLAHQFGAGTTLDLYYAAFRIPDLIFVGTGALVSVYILIPELAKRSTEEQRRYIDTILLGFSILAIAACSIAAFVAPKVLAYLYPQFVASGFLDELVGLTRIMLIQPILLGLSNICAALTQFRHRYALYSLSPILYNIGIIAGVVGLYPLFGITGLALGVVLGAFFHASVQMPSLMADGFFNRIPRFAEPRALAETALRSLPRALALSMTQVTSLGLTALAATLASGSVAIFTFAYNLESVPLAIIGASYSVAAFPTLAAALSRGEREAFIEHIATAARFIFFWSLPLAAFFIVLRAHIVRLVLGTGAFDWTATRLTAAALAVLVVALAAQGLMLLLIRGYYAAGRTFTPLFIQAATTFGILGLSMLFMDALRDQFLLAWMQDTLRISDVPGSAVLALMLAYSTVTILAAIGMTIHFEYRFPGFLAKIARSFGESACAALCGSGAAYVILTLLGPVTFASTTLSVFSRGFCAGVFGVFITGFVYNLLNNREFEETIMALRSRFRPAAVTVAAPAEETGLTGPQ